MGLEYELGHSQSHQCPVNLFTGTFQKGVVYETLDFKEDGICRLKLASCRTVTISAYAASLGVPITLQAPYSTGCWAASGAAVCKYYGTYIDIIGFANTCGLTPNTAGGMDTIIYGLSRYGISSVKYVNDSNFTLNTTCAKLKASIDNGYPVVFDVGSHAVVLNGYGNSETLSIMDPAYDTYITVSHSSIYSGANTPQYVLTKCAYTSK